MQTWNQWDPTTAAAYAAQGYQTSTTTPGAAGGYQMGYQYYGAPPTMPTSGTDMSGYSSQQWTVMQQQHWQEWQQWHQQFQQWQQQYGGKYPDAMVPNSAMAAAPAMDHSSTGGTGTTAATTQPPPLPPPDKSVPPPPPEEADPRDAQSDAFRASGGNTSKGPEATFDQEQFTNMYSMPPPSGPPPTGPSAMSVPPPNVKSDEYGKGDGYSPSKRPFEGDGSFRSGVGGGDYSSGGDSKRSRNDNFGAGGGYGYGGRNDGALNNSVDRRRGRWPSESKDAELPNPRDNPDELSEAEKAFDIQFKQWGEQFNKWKEQNINHPDKTQYREYELKWESWREQLLQRREQMRKKRENSKKNATVDGSKGSTSPGRGRNSRGGYYDGSRAHDDYRSSQEALNKDSYGAQPEQKSMQEGYSGFNVQNQGNFGMGMDPTKASPGHQGGIQNQPEQKSNFPNQSDQQGNQEPGVNAGAFGASPHDPSKNFIAPGTPQQLGTSKDSPHAQQQQSTPDNKPDASEASKLDTNAGTEAKSSTGGIPGLDLLTEQKPDESKDPKTNTEDMDVSIVLDKDDRNDNTQAVDGSSGPKPVQDNPNTQQAQGGFGAENQGQTKPLLAPQGFGLEVFNSGAGNQGPQGFGGSQNLGLGNQAQPNFRNQGNQDNFGLGNQSSGSFGPGNQQGPGNFGPGNQGSGNFGSGNPGPGNFGSGNQGPGNFGSGNQGPGNFGSGNQGPGSFGSGNQGPGNFGSRNQQGPSNFGPGTQGSDNFGQGNQQGSSNFGPSNQQGPGNFGPGNQQEPGNMQNFSQGGNRGPNNYMGFGKQGPMDNQKYGTNQGFNMHCPPPNFGSNNMGFGSNNNQGIGQNSNVRSTQGSTSGPGFGNQPGSGNIQNFGTNNPPNIDNFGNQGFGSQNASKSVGFDTQRQNFDNKSLLGNVPGFGGSNAPVSGYGLGNQPPSTNIQGFGSQSGTPWKDNSDDKKPWNQRDDLGISGFNRDVPPLGGRNDLQQGSRDNASNVRDSFPGTRDSFRNRDDFPGMRDNMGTGDNFSRVRESTGPRDDFPGMRDNMGPRDDFPGMRANLGARDNFPGLRDNLGLRDDFPANRDNIGLRDDFSGMRDNMVPRDDFSRMRPREDFPGIRENIGSRDDFLGMRDKGSRDGFPGIRDISSRDDFPGMRDNKGLRDDFSAIRDNLGPRDKFSRDIPPLIGARGSFPGTRDSLLGVRGDSFSGARDTFPSPRDREFHGARDLGSRDGFQSGRDGFPASRDVGSEGFSRDGFERFPPPSHGGPRGGFALEGEERGGPRDYPPPRDVEEEDDRGRRGGPVGWQQGPSRKVEAAKPEADIPDQFKAELEYVESQMALAEPPLDHDLDPKWDEEDMEDPFKDTTWPDEAPGPRRGQADIPEQFKAELEYVERQMALAEEPLDRKWDEEDMADPFKDPFKKTSWPDEAPCPRRVLDPPAKRWAPLSEERLPRFGRAPEWDEKLEPATVVDYGHRPVAQDAATTETPFNEPVQTFDYGHGASSRRPGAPDIPSTDSWRREEPAVPPFRGREREDRLPREREREREWGGRSGWDPERDAGKRDGRFERDRERNDRPSRWEDNDRLKVDRERDRDRDRERDRDRDRDRERERERDRDKDWGRRNRDRERERDRDRDGPRQRESRKDSPKKETLSSPPDAPPPPTLVPPVVRDPGPQAMLVEDLLCPPGRNTRPARLVMILRGPPGSGKTFVAKLIKDKEVEMGGSAPRILCLDDYFMVEMEKEEKDAETGRKVTTRVMEYEYEAGMDKHYRSSLVKAFRKTIIDGYFPFIIVDCINDKVKHFDEMWSFAKQKGFQVYIIEMDMDASVCSKRNIHNRTEKDINDIIKDWEDTPKHYLRVDVRSLLQSIAITEVEMEDTTNEPTDVVDLTETDNAETPTEEKPAEDNQEADEEVESNAFTSKWDRMDPSGEGLDRLDGLAARRRRSEDRPQTMEDWLQLPDDYQRRKATPGKKQVRWADLEERAEQEKMRAIGFVVGQTDWNRMMDPTFGESALTQTKYI